MMHKGAVMATKKKTEADSKGKLKFSSPLDMQEHGADKAPKETSMDLGVKIMNLVSESGTTEAEYQEPAVRVDPLEREYPDLRQDIPKILKAILRELVIARFGNDR